MRAGLTGLSACRRTCCWCSPQRSSSLRLRLSHPRVGRYQPTLCPRCQPVNRRHADDRVCCRFSAAAHHCPSTPLQWGAPGGCGRHRLNQPGGLDALARAAVWRGHSRYRRPDAHEPTTTRSVRRGTGMPAARQRPDRERPRSGARTREPSASSVRLDLSGRQLRLFEEQGSAAADRPPRSSVATDPGRTPDGRCDFSSGTSPLS